MTEPVYFDRIHDHFIKNIYTRPKGKIRLAVLERDLSPILRTTQSMQILDVGGGSGQMALWALSLGHHVTLIDVSAQMLDDAWQLAHAANLSRHLTVCQGDAGQLNALIQDARFDVVFCHALLEWVEEGERLMSNCLHALKAHGVLSLLHYNRQALLFAHHVFGNFDYLDEYLQQDLVNKNAAKLTPQWIRPHQQVQQWLQASGGELMSRRGVRCFYDYMKVRDKERNSLQEIITRELALSEDEDYLPVARYIHDLWQRVGKSSLS